MAYIDDRLLDRVAYGFAPQTTWATTQVRLISGRSKRNAERSQPLHRYIAPYQNIDEEHRQLVVSTYNACLGPVHAFRFKDWADYTLSNVVIGESTGDTDELIQIVKPYSFGPVGNVYTLNRKITKPVDSAVFTSATPLSVTANGSPIAFACDYTTGILTINSTIGYIIRVTGEFDVPVHFEDDTLELDYNNWDALSGEVVLIEDFGA